MLKREVYVGSYPWRPYRNISSKWHLHRDKGWPFWAVHLDAALP